MKSNIKKFLFIIIISLSGCSNIHNQASDETGEYIITGLSGCSNIHNQASSSDLSFDMFDIVPLNSEHAKIVGCNKIDATDIVIPNSINNYTITEVGPNFLKDNDQITNITLPSTMKNISKNAFSGLPNLERVIFSGECNVTSIGDNAFENCSMLETFNSDIDGSLCLPESLQKLGRLAFSKCAFTNIEINSSFDLGLGAFSSILTLESFSQKKSNSNFIVYNDVLYDKKGNLLQYPIGKNDKTFKIPSIIMDTNIISTSSYSFYNAINLVDVDFGNIAEISSYSFTGCSNLVHLKMPNSITHIYNYAFSDCTGIQNISLSENLISIGKYSFANCSSLEEIVIPSRVEMIDSYAFSGCESLKNVTINNDKTSITKVGEYAFDYQNENLRIHVPRNVILDYKYVIIDTPGEKGKENNWYDYRQKISEIDDNSDYPTFTLTGESINETFNLEAGHGIVYKLIIEEEHSYEFNANSDNLSIKMRLFDSNMEAIKGCFYEYTREKLYKGKVYYLCIEINDPSVSGMVNFVISKYF